MEIQRAVARPSPDDDGLGLIEDFVEEPETASLAGSDTQAGERRQLAKPMPIAVPS